MLACRAGDCNDYAFRLIIALIRSGVDCCCIYRYPGCQLSVLIGSLPCPALGKRAPAYLFRAVRRIHDIARHIRCGRRLLHRNLDCHLHLLIVCRILRCKYHSILCDITVCHRRPYCSVLPDKASLYRCCICLAILHGTA